MSDSTHSDISYQRLNDDAILTDSSNIPQETDTSVVPNVDETLDTQPTNIKSKKSNKKHRKQKKKVVLEESEDVDVEVITFDEYCDNVKSVLIPVALTLICTIIVIKMLQTSDSVYMTTTSLIFSEQIQDSLPIPIWLIAIITAVFFVTMIVIVTFIFVLLFYFRCMKIMIGWLLFSVTVLLLMFGGMIFRNMLIVFNSVVDWFTFIFLLVNFAVLGVISIFYVSPMKLNQFFMITISVFMASFFSNLPEWTTWMVLISMAIYDLAAVLCPKGPLKILVNLAQERNEPIPALVYSTAVWMGMVNNETDEINTGDSNQFTLSSKKGRGIKLGLGDFVFYSVLVGRCALYDLTICFSASIAVISGLVGTLILLVKWNKALPALPISIFMGTAVYCISRWCMVPLVTTTSSNGFIL
ncbi:Presenilin [Entamoeba marina]